MAFLTSSRFPLKLQISPRLPPDDDRDHVELTSCRLPSSGNFVRSDIIQIEIKFRRLFTHFPKEALLQAAFFVIRSTTINFRNPQKIFRQEQITITRQK